MGAVSSIAHKKMRMLRERYIHEEDNVIFRLLSIRDKIVTDLVKIMAKMDTDENGTVTLTQFYHYLGFENRFVVPMAKRMFKAFDHRQKAHLRFIDLVIVVYNMCLATEKDVVNFIFDVYHQMLADKNDDDGQRDSKGEALRCINLPIITQLFQEAFGNRKFDAETKELLKYLRHQSRRKQRVSKKQFQQYVFSNRRVLGFWPCFILQRLLRTKVLGDNFWLNMQFSDSGMPRPPGVALDTGLLSGNFMKNTFAVGDPRANRDVFKKEAKRKAEARADRTYVSKGGFFAGGKKVRYY